MTTTFYAPPDHISANQVTLPEDEARHAVQVLRHRVGDEIVVVDGAGGWYRLKLSRVGKKKAVGDIIEKKLNVGEPNYTLTVGVALLKNQNRLDVFIEKSSELGVTRIIPITTHRTQKNTIREKRIDKLLISSMKQCGRSRKVSVDEVTPFQQLLDRRPEKHCMIAHEQMGAEKALLKNLSLSENDLFVLIGPEGGFTDEEVESALQAGYKPISLGDRRLRAETAAIAVCSGIMLVFDC